MPPEAAAAKPKPKVKAVKARVITVNAVDENGRPRGLLERAKSIAQKRRANKPLGHLFTKLAETSTLDISQVRKFYEAVESVLTSDLKEHGVFRLPGLATFFRKELPPRPDSEKYVCGRLVKVPARGSINKVRIAVSTQLKATMS